MPTLLSRLESALANCATSLKQAWRSAALARKSLAKGRT